MNVIPKRIVRGDNKTFVVSSQTVNKETKEKHEKPFVSGDSVTMTVRKQPGQGNALITKTVTTFHDGKAVFDFIPSDTSNLAFGKYVYDVQATYHDIGVKTIVETSEFVIGTEVTY